MLIMPLMAFCRVVEKLPSNAIVGGAGYAASCGVGSAPEGAGGEGLELFDNQVDRLGGVEVDVHRPGAIGILAPSRARKIRREGTRGSRRFPPVVTS